MPSPVVVPSKYYMYVLYTSFLSNKKICMKKLSLTLFYLVLSHRLDLHRSTPTTPPPHASITVYVFIIYYLLLIFLILTDTDHNPGGGSGFEHEQTSWNLKNNKKQISAVMNLIVPPQHLHMYACTVPPPLLIEGGRIKSIQTQRAWSHFFRGLRSHQRSPFHPSTYMQVWVHTYVLCHECPKLTGTDVLVHAFLPTAETLLSIDGWAQALTDVYTTMRLGCIYIRWCF